MTQVISNGKQHGSLASSIGKRNYSLLHLQSHFGVKIQIFWFVETVEFTRKIIRILLSFGHFLVFYEHSV